MFEFKVQSSYDDYLAANWLTFRRAWIAWRTACVIVMFVIGLTMAIFATDCIECSFSWQRVLTNLGLATKITGVIFGGLLLISVTTIPSQSRKTFAQLGTVEQEVSYRITAAGFDAFSATGTSHLEWKHLTDFLHDDRTLLLRRTASIIYIIPLIQLEHGYSERLVAILRTGGVKEG